MKRFLIALAALSMTAASCNIFSGTFDVTSGSKGVFKSEDNAESFHPSNRISKKADIGGVSANVLAFDPKNYDIIYLGFSGGAYRSKDAGENWQLILTGMAIADMAVDPFNSDVIYAAGIAENNGKIIRSVDGGGSWNEIYTEPTKSSPVTAMALAVTDPKLIIAGLGTGEIIRSSDQGKTWQAIDDFGDRVVRIRQAGGNFYAMLQRKGMAKSSNQGIGWSLVQPKDVRRPIADGRSQSIASRQDIGAYYDIALDQARPGTIYLGTDQGLIRSTNDGISWSGVTMPVTDSNLAVSAVSLVPGNTNGLLAAIGPVVFKTTNGGSTWENKRLTTDQTVRTILINPQSTNIVYLGMGVKK